MVSNKKQLLLIIYRFPPMGGIGSRRWAKFCKYLSRSGWDLHVITTEYPWVDTINWQCDIENLPNLKVLRLPSGYPPIFLRPQSKNQSYNIWVEIYRRIFYIINRKKITLDYASLWAEKLVAFASDYIRKERIANLIVSGPPSSLHLSGALIKSEVPWVKLIQDYRDPWNNVHDVSINTLRSAKEKSQILKEEALALQVADHVVVVTEQMAFELRQIFSISPQKISVIFNGFDSEDYPIESNHNLIKKFDKIKVAYFGQFGLDPKGRLAGLCLIAEALDSLPKIIRERYDFLLYSDIPVDYFANSVSPVLREAVKCHEMVPQKFLAEIMAQVDICLSINRQEDGYAIASKVFDYIGAKKTILQVAPPGEAFDMLTKAGQYVINYDFKNATEVMKKIIHDYDSEDGLAPIDSDVYSDFNLLSLTDKYSKLLRR